CRGGLSRHEVGGPVATRRAVGGDAEGPASHYAFEALFPHDPLDRAARDWYSLPPRELPPDLPRSVRLEVGIPDAPDLYHQRCVPQFAGRTPRGIVRASAMLVVGRWGNRQLR